LSRRSDSELGKTLEIYRKVSIALNTFPRNEEISIEDLAKKAGVHWNTARKAVLLFNSINKISPRFRMVSKSKFRITEKPNAMSAVEGIFESLEMRILVKLILLNATEERTASKVTEFLEDKEKQILQELISKGFVNSIEGRFYLSKRGQSLASVGMRELAELGIDFPWEKPSKLMDLEFERRMPSISYVSVNWSANREYLNAITRPRRQPVWNFQCARAKDYQGWSVSRQKKQKAFCFTK